MRQEAINPDIFINHDAVDTAFIAKYGDKPVVKHDMTMIFNEALEAEKLYCPAEYVVQRPLSRAVSHAGMLALAGSLQPEDMALQHLAVEADQ